MRKVGDKDLTRSLDRPWQEKAYDLVDEVGEIGYALNLKAGLVAACNLQPEKWDPARREWRKTDDEAVMRVMAAFIGPQGGQAELLRRAALHLSIAGEAILLGTPAQEGRVDTGLLWEFLSTIELQIRGDGTVWRRRDGGAGAQVPAEAYAARMWRAHPRASDMADSEMRRSLQLAQEVQLLGQLVQAVARSRLAANVLYVPEEITFVSDDPEGDVEDLGDDAFDPFVEELLSHLSAPVNDRSSAAGLVPLIIRGPGDAGENIRVIEIARDLDSLGRDLRDEALRRLARSLDMPPEVLEGKSDLAGLGGGNVAMSIDVDLIVRHVAPPGRLIADFATFAYLRPMLEEFEGLRPAQSQGYRLTFDLTPVMARQNEAAEAQRLYALDPALIDSDVVVRASGYSATDRPDDDELFQRRAWKLIESQPGIFAKALLPKIKGFEDVDPDSLGGGEEPPSEDAPEETEEVKADDTRPPADGVLVARLHGLAEGAVDRARERAASRVLTLSSRHDDIGGRLQGVEKSQVLAVATVADLRTMKVTSNELLRDAWGSLAMRARQSIRAELVDRGVDAMLADDRAALAASTLASNVDEWLRAHLHDPPRADARGMTVPRSLVISAVAGLTDDA